MDPKPFISDLDTDPNPKADSQNDFPFFIGSL
jgi:hypothetical protein